MDRLRVASALAVVAVLAVLAATAVAVVAYVVRDDGPAKPAPGGHDPAPTLTIRDPASGATFAVPSRRWRVEERRVRIFYADDAGRPVAVVRGPAVYRAGYCSQRPRDSNRAFAGFTRDPFGAWVAALGSERMRTVQDLTLPDGTAARLSWARVDPDAAGPCAAPQVDVAMIRARDVRVVLVSDTGAPGTLGDEQVEPILRSLALRAS
jgi:hypothetical protein